MEYCYCTVCRHKEKCWGVRHVCLNSSELKFVTECSCSFTVTPGLSDGKMNWVRLNATAKSLKSHYLIKVVRLRYLVLLLAVVGIHTLLGFLSRLPLIITNTFEVKLLKVELRSAISVQGVEHLKHAPFSAEKLILSVQMQQEGERQCFNTQLQFILVSARVFHSNLMPDSLSSPVKCFSLQSYRSRIEHSTHCFILHEYRD